jgi:hypothetical protein
METRRIKLLGLAAALFFLLAGTAFAQLSVVTNIPGGGPEGQEEDPDCVAEGQYAMRTRTVPGVDDAMFVQADAANGFDQETIVRQQFWFHPRSLQAGLNVKHFINTALRDGGGKAPFRLILFRNQNADLYKLALACNANCPGGVGCGNKRTSKVTLADAYNLILVEWAHSDPAPAPANGVCRVSIIDGPAAPAEGTLGTPLRNTQPVTAGIKLGMQGAVLHPSTDGDHCFDDFQSFRTLAPQ